MVTKSTITTMDKFWLDILNLTFCSVGQKANTQVKFMCHKVFFFVLNLLYAANDF